MKRKLNFLIFSTLVILVAGVLAWSIIGCSKGGKEGERDADDQNN